MLAITLIFIGKEITSSNKNARSLIFWTKKHILCDRYAGVDGEYVLSTLVYGDRAARLGNCDCDGFSRPRDGSGGQVPSAQARRQLDVFRVDVQVPARCYDETIVVDDEHAIQLSKFLDGLPVFLILNVPAFFPVAFVGVQDDLVGHVEDFIGVADDEGGPDLFTFTAFPADVDRQVQNGLEDCIIDFRRQVGDLFDQRYVGDVYDHDRVDIADADNPQDYLVRYLALNIGDLDGLAHKLDPGYLEKKRAPGSSFRDF